MPDVFVSPHHEEDLPSDSSEKLSKKLTAPSGGVLSAYCAYPKGARFSTQLPKEEIILILRRHPVTNVPWVIVAVLMFFAPSLVSIFPILSFLPANFQLVAFLIWYLLLTAFVLEEFLSWFFNVNIVTNQRVIDVDFLNLVYREMTDAENEKIQDVTVRMGGVIRALLNYGDVLIQTAGEIPEIEFQAIPKPDNVAKIIYKLREKVH